MKTVVDKNCMKKVKLSNQKRTMAEIGTNAFVKQRPKKNIGIDKISIAKYG